MSALFAAVIGGDVGGARKLLAAKDAKVTDTDALGQTPLHLAAYHGNKRMVEMLLTFDPPLRVQANDGMTPLDLALEGEEMETAALLQKKQHAWKRRLSAARVNKVKAILAKGAPPAVGAMAGGAQAGGLQAGKGKGGGSGRSIVGKLNGNDSFGPDAAQGRANAGSPGFAGRGGLPKLGAAGGSSRAGAGGGGGGGGRQRRRSITEALTGAVGGVVGAPAKLAESPSPTKQHGHRDSGRAERNSKRNKVLYPKRHGHGADGAAGGGKRGEPAAGRRGGRRGGGPGGALAGGRNAGTAGGTGIAGPTSWGADGPGFAGDGAATAEAGAAAGEAHGGEAALPSLGGPGRRGGEGGGGVAGAGAAAGRRKGSLFGQLIRGDGHSGPGGPGGTPHRDGGAAAIKNRTKIAMRHMDTNGSGAGGAGPGRGGGGGGGGGGSGAGKGPRKPEPPSPRTNWIKGGQDFGGGAVSDGGGGRHGHGAGGRSNAGRSPRHGMPTGGGGGGGGGAGKRHHRDREAGGGGDDAEEAARVRAREARARRYAAHQQGTDAADLASVGGGALQRRSSTGSGSGATARGPTPPKPAHTMTHNNIVKRLSSRRLLQDNKSRHGAGGAHPSMKPVDEDLAAELHRIEREAAKRNSHNRGMPILGVGGGEGGSGSSSTGASSRRVGLRREGSGRRVYGGGGGGSGKLRDDLGASGGVGGLTPMPAAAVAAAEAASIAHDPVKSALVRGAELTSSRPAFRPAELASPQPDQRPAMPDVSGGSTKAPFILTPVGGLLSPQPVTSTSTSFFGESSGGGPPTNVTPHRPVGAVAVTGAGNGYRHGHRRIIAGDGPTG